MRHDWSAPVVETLQWVTRVSASRGEVRQSGATWPVHEARTAVAPVPLRTIATLEWLDPAAEAAYAGGDLTRVLGYRPGATELAAPGSSAFIAMADPALRGYEVGGYCVLERGDGSQVTRLVTGMSGSLLQLASAVAWDAGDTVMPGFDARRSGELPITWRSPRVRIAPEQWTFVAPARWDASELGDYDDLAVAWDPVETYAGHEVVAVRGVSSARLSVEDRRMQSDANAWAARQPHHEWRDAVERTYTLYGRRAIWSFRRMLYRRAGRLVGAFVPTGRALAYLGTRSYLGDTYLAFDASMLPALHDVVVAWCLDGSRAIVDASQWEGSGSVTLPVEVGEAWISAPVSLSSEVESVDWLMYARLDSDAVAITHLSTEVAQVTLGWVQTQRPPDAEVGVAAWSVKAVFSATDHYQPASLDAAWRAALLFTAVDGYVPPVYSEDTGWRSDVIFSATDNYEAPPQSASWRVAGIFEAADSYTAPPVEIELHGANLHHAPLRLRGGIETFP